MYSISNNLRTILTTIVILALGFFAYEYLFKSAASEVQISDNGSTTAQNVPGKEVFDLYKTVDTLSFDSSVFASALFDNLTDFTVPLPKIPVGRNNPFAPIGVGGVRTTITTGSTGR